MTSTTSSSQDWGNYANVGDGAGSNGNVSSPSSSLNSSPIKPPSVVSIKNDASVKSPSYRPKSPSILLSPARGRRASRSWSKNALLPGQSKYANQNQATQHFAAIEKIFNVEFVSEIYGK